MLTGLGGQEVGGGAKGGVRLDGGEERLFRGGCEQGVGTTEAWLRGPLITVENEKVD